MKKYILFSRDDSVCRRAIENFSFTVVLLLLTFKANFIPFYIYVLCNRNVFRQEFLILMRTIYQNLISPIG